VNAPLATAIRSAVRAAGFEIPVVTSGKIHTFEQAETLLQEERADLIGMARALLADPDLPRKWLAGADQDLRACVYCPYCEHEDQHHRVVTCVLWPKHAQDHRLHVTPGVWQPGVASDPNAVFVPPSGARSR
jgi:2,4-dienoyl-CoA reductase-like NADH-dependent reductase (Old Yellow Enzyme family)